MMINRNETVLNFSWFLGLAAALFLAFGPAVMPVLSGSKTQTIEICTAFGQLKKIVAGDFFPAEADQQKQDHTDRSGHCLFCHLRSAALAPPIYVLPIPALPGVRVKDCPESLCQSFGTPPAYNPRAPPILPV